MTRSRTRVVGFLMGLVSASALSVWSCGSGGADLSASSPSPDASSGLEEGGSDGNNEGGSDDPRCGSWSVPTHDDFSTVEAARSQTGTFFIVHEFETKVTTLRLLDGALALTWEQEADASRALGALRNGDDGVARRHGEDRRRR